MIKLKGENQVMVNKTKMRIYSNCSNKTYTSSITLKCCEGTNLLNYQIQYYHYYSMQVIFKEEIVTYVASYVAT